MGPILNQINPEKLKPIRQIVFEQLRNAILKGKLKPNERLIEEDIARQMYISRTPVREALRMLEKEGLVVKVPRKGILVAEFSVNDLNEIYKIRGALESLAAWEAIDNITEEEIKELESILETIGKSISNGLSEEMISQYERFDHIISRASRNRRLCEFIDTMCEYLEMTRVISLSSSERQIEAYEEHRAILNALKEGNHALVDILVKKHVENARQAYLKNLAK